MGFWDEAKDYLPTSVEDVAGSALVGGPLYSYLWGQPAKGVKKAYDEQAGQTQDRAMRLRDFLMGQQQKALDFYKPAQGLFQNAYGTQGLKPMGGGQ